MTKKEYILNHEPVAHYYNGLNGVEIYGVEFGIEDYIYCVSGSCNGKPNYHRLKIYHDSDISYFKLHGYKVPLNECIRRGA